MLDHATAEFGQIVYRQEGDHYVARYAPRDTLDGSIVLCKVLFRAANENATILKSLHLMARACVSDILDSQLVCAINATKANPTPGSTPAQIGAGVA